MGPAALEEQANPVESAALAVWVASADLVESAVLVVPAAENGNTTQVIVETRRMAIAEAQINLDRQTIDRVPAHRIDPAAERAVTVHLLGRPAEKAAVLRVVPVGVGADREQPHDHLLVAIALAIILRRVRVTEIAAVALVVAAEIMRARAALAADAAWAVADLAAVAAEVDAAAASVAEAAAAVVAAVADVVVAVDVGDKRNR